MADVEITVHTSVPRFGSVLNKIAEAQDWTGHRREPLTGYPYDKLRAGEYRVIISWDREDDILCVEAVGHRRNVYYRHLPP